MTAAVCYVASAGYLFQTTLSAIQARKHLHVPAPIYVTFLTTGSTRDFEADVFEPVLASHDVALLRLDIKSLGGLHAMFGRYYLDEVLPKKIDRILYLDGDTQVLQGLDPLLRLIPAHREVLACRDPMVFVHEVDSRKRLQIDQWWDRVGIEMPLRRRYVNSGMMVVDRAHLGELREGVARCARDRPDLVFADQDALNLVVGDHIGLLSARWNFPGFLLGTAMEKVAPPRLVRFMSDPRPWRASLPPWGQRFHQPYLDLVRAEPSLRGFHERYGYATMARYVVQQAYKQVVERRVLSGPVAARVAQELEGTVDHDVD